MDRVFAVDDQILEYALAFVTWPLFNESIVLVHTKLPQAIDS
jgi:hypothetical protein